MTSIVSDEVKYDDGNWHLQAAAGRTEDNALTHIACVVCSAVEPWI